MAAIVHLERVAEQLQRTKSEMEEALSRENTINRQVDKELKDIERLEGLSTRAIFYKVLGSKEEQIDKERQEYLEVVLKADSIKEEINLLQYELDILEGKMDQSADLNHKLEVLKAKREEEIIRLDPVRRAQLVTLSKQLEVQYQLQPELQEAMDMSLKCHALLGQVVDQLGRVRNWGQWPAQRRGMHSLHQRRQAMDRARNLTFQVKHHLNLLDQELRDVGQRLDMEIDMGALSKFSDFFFNNIITDWILNQQVSSSMDAARSAHHHVQDIIEGLQSRIKAAEGEIATLLAQRATILTS